MSSITINIKGQFVSKSSKNAGTVGSANTTELTIIFDEEWRGYAKRIIWLDAKGENETSILLIPEIADITSVYKSYIPGEVTALEGWCSFTVEGYYESDPSKVYKSVTDRLFVAHSQIKNITEVTPDEAMQLHAEFEQLMPKVNSLMEDTKEELSSICKEINSWENYSESSCYKVGNKVSYRGRCYVCIKDVGGVSPENADFWLMIADRGEKGAKGEQGPQGIRGEKGYTGEKGDKGDKGDKGEQGERGISGTMVPSNGFYCFNVDEEGNLWVNYPDKSLRPDISLNENGELIISVEGSTNSYNLGVVKGEKGEDGYTPIKGVDYFTEADIKSLDIPNDKLNSLRYYGDIDVVPSDADLFEFTTDDATMTACIYNYDITNYIDGDIVIPYEYISGGKSYTVTEMVLSVYITKGSWRLPNTLKHITQWIDCSLDTAVVPDGVETIGAFGFASNFNMINITLPKSLKSIGEYSFNDCTDLKDVYYGGTKAQWDAIEIGEGNEPLLNATIHYSWSDVTKDYVDEKIRELDSRISDAFDRIIPQETDIADLKTWKENIDREFTDVYHQVNANATELANLQLVTEENGMHIVTHASVLDDLQKDMSEVETNIGDIETALDRIIEIQNTLIGGESV